jgi:single-strand DNA-binding protein
MNKAILVGNLTRDAELKTTPSGKAVATVGIATNERWKDANGQKQEKVTFHNLVIWGKAAEALAQYLKKGKKMLVEGRIDNRSYDKKDGSGKGYTSEIVVSQVEFLSSPTDAAAARPAAPAPTHDMAAVKERMADVEPPAGHAYGEEEIRVEDIPF